MLKYLSLAGLMALTAACAQITPPVGNIPAQPSKCVAEAAASLIGSHGLDNAQIMQRTGASEVRRLHPNSPATMDYRETRITVVNDPLSKKIIRASCG